MKGTGLSTTAMRSSREGEVGAIRTERLQVLVKEIPVDQPSEWKYRGYLTMVNHGGKRVLPA